MNDRLQKNLARWAKFCPEAAQKIPQLSLQHVSICSASNGQPNLKTVVDGAEYFFHSMENPSKEAIDTAQGLDLEEAEVVFIYGLGLGYLYDAFQGWLNLSKQHFLVFFEDDLEVIRLFLDTDRAADLLYHPQVWLVHLDDMHDTLSKTLDLFPAQPFKVLASGLYQSLYPAKILEFKSRVEFISNLKKVYLAEFKAYGIGFLSNYYRNLFYLPQAYLGGHFANTFYGIPAIICGAGPSLKKNIELLGTLQNRALIFAGGSALNAINAAGIQPHFGVGIDPNREQFTRIIMNTAYEIPFFYRNRMFHTALSLVHGDRLFLGGSSGYAIGDYFDGKFNVPGSHLEEGCNVINFSVAIASLLGCNPLVLVGVDLSYTDNQSYAPGIIPHPIHLRKENIRTKDQHEELIVKKDIYGNDVYTLWKWVTESLWYTNLSYKSPTIRLINATEGGLGFPNVPNMTLAEAAEKYMPKPYDFIARIHAETQNAHPSADVTFEAIIQSMKELGASFEQCQKITRAIIGELAYLSSRNAEEKSIPEDLQNKEIKDAVQQLERELGYQYLIKDFDSTFDRIAKRDVSRFETDGGLISPMELRQKKLDLAIRRYKFLRESSQINADHIRGIVAEQEAKHKRLEAKSKSAQSKDSAPKDPLAGTVYSYQDHVLKIVDPEFGLNSEEKFVPDVLEGALRLHHPNGALKVESLYKEGILHGPSSYYNPEGILLARTWYLNGQSQGKSVCYYASGVLKSVFRNRDGKWDGLQEHYFENGIPRAQIGYNKGVLHGDVLLYLPSGRLARELHYAQGKRNGVERIWTDEGFLIIEAYFKDDLPVGTARLWYPNGNVAQEYAYDDDGHLLSVRKWTEDGFPLPEEKLASDDYFDKVAKQADGLTKNLSGIFEQLAAVAPLMVEAGGKKDEGLTESLQADMDEIRRDLAKLQELSKEMAFESGVSPESEKEAIWKSPSARREIERKVDEMSQGMAQGIMDMQKSLKQSMEDLAKKLKDDKK